MGRRSTATYGYEGLLHDMLPSDRIDMRDPITSEGHCSAHTRLGRTADHGQCSYEIWTHLGEQHPLHLSSQLRYVTGYR